MVHIHIPPKPTPPSVSCQSGTNTSARATSSTRPVQVIPIAKAPKPAGTWQRVVTAHGRKFNMADRGGGSRGGGFGARGDRGGERGRGRGRRGGRRGGKSEEKEWQPVTKLGRLVKSQKITSMEEIYLHSLPIKEFQIVDSFLPKLKDEVMKVRPRTI